MLFVFFYKQKTAYEMRISDWSSDVCSSDLEKAARSAGRRRPARPGAPPVARIDDQGAARKRLLAEICRRGDDPPRPPRPQPQRDRRDRGRDARRPAGAGAPLSDRRPGAGHQGGERQGGNVRSEEHTSELQSLMRISYAVCCLKKK